MTAPLASDIVASPRAGVPAAGPTTTWDERISAAWQKYTAAIIETGRLLIQAKDGLEHRRVLQAGHKSRRPISLPRLKCLEGRPMRSCRE
jgi:hypothetical protein